MVYCENRCFISLVIEALSIKRKFKLYTVEKECAKAGIVNSEENRCICTKFSKLYDSFFRSKNTGVEKNGFCHRLFVEDSLENFVLKSVLGFLGGILLTYLCFMFLVFSLNFTLKRATYICMGLGIILSLGLAFSVKIRCTVFLCIPQLFTKRGRQALLAYAFILALSGPAKNTLHNVEVMSESLACGQEQIKKAENELLKCIQKPNTAAKKSIEKLLEKLNSAVKDFKHFILQLYKNCFDILETVLHSQNWLYSVTSLCNKKMGEPAQRCSNLLTESSENCKAIRPWEQQWVQLCEIDSHRRNYICGCVAKSVCLKKDLPRRLPVFRLQKQLDNFRQRVMNIFYVKIEVHQTFSQTNRSCTYHEEYQGVATEIRQKTDQFLQYFDFMSVIFGIFIMVLFVKVIIYRYKFLTEDHYDNRFITHDLVDIDRTRAEFQMEPLLPLEPRERMKYIKVTSIRLVPCEKVRLLSSFIFLVFATFKIIIHMMTDSSLYWILSSVRRDERLLYMSSIKEEEPGIIAHILGRGLVAALFENVTTVIKQQSVTSKLDPTPCLPDPVPPDWNRYCQILALVLMCWLLALCEPYGLRLRHSVMITYHPDRARERAIWLYNRIISNRINFAKMTRRQIRRKYKDVPQDTFFRFQFMKNKINQKCLLCKIKINPEDEDNFKCPTQKCIGLYCSTCFGCLKYCSICTDPADYGDLSDLSEEKDSSDDEEPCYTGRRIVRRPCDTKVTISTCRTCSPSTLHTSSYGSSRKKIHDIYPKKDSTSSSQPSTGKSSSKNQTPVKHLSDLSDSSDWESDKSYEDDTDEDKTNSEKLLLKCQTGKSGRLTDDSRSHKGDHSCRRHVERRKSKSSEYVPYTRGNDEDNGAFDRKFGQTVYKPDFRFRTPSKIVIDDDMKPSSDTTIEDVVAKKMGGEQRVIQCEYFERVNNRVEKSLSSFHERLSAALEKGFLLNEESEEDNLITYTENVDFRSPPVHYLDDKTKQGAYFMGDAIIEDVASFASLRDGVSMARGTCIKEEVTKTKSEESVLLSKSGTTRKSLKFSSKDDIFCRSASSSDPLKTESKDKISSSESDSQFYSPTLPPEPHSQRGHQDQSKTDSKIHVIQADSEVTEVNIGSYL